MIQEAADSNAAVSRSGKIRPSSPKTPRERERAATAIAA
jgi:hypothetical protein